MKIAYLPANIDAAGCLRCLFPARELRKLGHEAAMVPHVVHQVEDGKHLVEFCALARDGKGVRRIGTDEMLPLLNADVYVFQMPLDKGVHDLIGKLRERGAKVVCEADDDHVGIPVWNPAFESTDPVTHPDRNRDWMFKSFQAADAMSVSTPFLAERYWRMNPNIRVVPNYLDWEMWDEVVPSYEVERRRIRIGWMGQMLWRRGDLQVLRGVIGPWLRQNPGVEFVAAGDPQVHDFLDVPHEQRVTTANLHYSMLPRDQKQANWFQGARVPMELHRLPDITATMDIGLVPLEMIPFNEAKSNLKGLEYAASGIPCVASPTESYRAWAATTDSCLLARRARDWVRHLDSLVADDALRRHLGQEARRAAASQTIQGHISAWESFFKGVCNRSDANLVGAAGAAA